MLLFEIRSISRRSTTILALIGSIACFLFPEETTQLTMSRSHLADKIRGGWAGQVIGCTLGGPIEHRFPSSLVPDSYKFLWSVDQIASQLKNSSQIYDDLYVDMVFLETIGKKGLNASAKDFAKALLRGQFLLHHGLQMSRHNFLAGLKPPKTGFWQNNPHADDNDFQKTADVIGMLAPGMPQVAVRLSDRIGHIISSGDGWYGGVYIALLYSLAFVQEDRLNLVQEALRFFPDKSAFYQVIRDVLDGYRQNPRDWEKTWVAVEKKWGKDVACPDGVLSPLNFEAKVNAAWVTIGLLYGNGDFDETVSITIRCGDDTDSNAANAGGIIGALLGYQKIPEFWKKELKEVEQGRFGLGNLSLAEAYQANIKQALEMVRRNGGKIKDEVIALPRPKFRSLRFETNFGRLYPKERRRLDLRLTELKPEVALEFEGAGFVINGSLIKNVQEDHTYIVAMVVDGRLAAAPILPAHPYLRNPTPFFKFNLRPGRHRLFLQINEPSAKADVQLDEIIIYDWRRENRR
ncbi:MAG: ADP-ribosylglycohydrolase family protein [Candidatus Aminicenantales bacterium]